MRQQRRCDPHRAGERDDLVAPDPLLQPDARRVERLREGGAHVGDAEMALAIVARPPAADRERRIVDQAVGRGRAAQRREVDEELEQRARLAPRLHGAIELALCIVPTPGHREDRAVRRHRNQCGLARGQSIPLAGEPFRDRAPGQRLQTPIDRRRDDEVAADLAEQAARFGRREVGGVAEHRLLDGRRGELCRMSLCLACRRGADQAGLGHRGEHDRGAPARVGERSGRRKARGRLDQARQHRRLGKRQLLRRLGEIASARGIDAIGPGAEIDRIEIAREDFVLRQAALQPDRQHRLLDLARPAALGREEPVLGELLGDRAAALDRLAGGEIRQRGARDAAEIEAVMLEEAPVLDREDRVDQMPRQRGQFDRPTARPAPDRERLAVGCGELKRDPRRLLEVLVAAATGTAARARPAAPQRRRQKSTGPPDPLPVRRGPVCRGPPAASVRRPRRSRLQAIGPFPASSLRSCQAWSIYATDLRLRRPWLRTDAGASLRLCRR